MVACPQNLTVAYLQVPGTMLAPGQLALVVFLPASSWGRQMCCGRSTH